MAIEYDGKSNYARTALNRKYLELYEPLLKSENLSQDTITFIIESKHNKRPDALYYKQNSNGALNNLRSQSKTLSRYSRVRFI